MALEEKEVRGTGGGFGGLLAVTTGLALTGFGGFLLLSVATADVHLDPAASAEICWTGLLGAWVSFWMVHTLGRIPAMVLAALVVFWGLHAVRRARFLGTWPQVAGGIVMIGSLSMGLCAFTDRYDIGTGGLFTVYLSPPAILYFGRWGLALTSAVILFLGILLAFGEMAVFGIRGALATVRDCISGCFCMVGRLGELLRILFSPRLAVAGAGRGEAICRDPAGGLSGSASRQPAPAAGEDKDSDEDKSPETAKADKRKVGMKVWRPREGFASRFLALDLRSDPAVEVVDAAMAADPAESGVIDVPNHETDDAIMDADDEAGDSDAGESGKIDLFAREERPAAIEPDDAEEEEAVAPPIRPAAQPVKTQARQAETRKAAAPRGPTAGEAAADLKNYILPSMELLDPPEPPPVEDRNQLEQRAKILEQTLAEFKIEGRVVHIECGPRVTMYEISLAPGIRLNKVTSLADNIAMQLKAESVRIIAPIPGKDTIGIEIPNTDKELVSLREIVAAVSREKRRQALPICLGKDVSGASLVADLAKMPHLLIAGATGSGKSVCINSVIMSVLMCCRPDEAQLIMIDPKVVELSRFKDIPHLMSPVITDMKRAVAVLEWICQKMDERYEQMSQVAVNNIAKFNALGEEEIRERLDAFSSLEEIDAFPKAMPYMVVIIDELADLMMVSGKEVEQHITRLAAKSRAVGIHLILATQRPSVDVITGLIKANMPCRIAFQVASRVDSRTILDQNGAESLLGQGDMLYLPPGVGRLTRAQGVFVSDEELFRVVAFAKSEAGPQYHTDLLGPVIGGGGDVDVSSFDELFLEAGEAIIENQRGSVSLLQRKFGIGYGRASRIIDQLASAGLLGPFRDGKAREILMTMEDFSNKFRGADDPEDDGDSLAGLRDDEMGPKPDPWEDGED